MILFLNHHIKNCGVQQYGRRIADLLLQTSLNVEYREIRGVEDYEGLVAHFKPSIIIFNWYPITMGWLSPGLFKPGIRNYLMFHDGHMHGGDATIIFTGAYEKPDSIRYPDNKKILLPRPLFKYDGAYRVNSVPNIGSFGFGFWHKGFYDIVTWVNREFSEATINLHMPYAHFGDAAGVQAREVAAQCLANNTNPNITLNMTSHLMEDNELLEFLAGNDMNVFMYGGVSEGLSSVLDYALSVKRPIALTDNMMFRHIASPEITMSPDNSLKDILARGTEPLERFYEEWSVENFIKKAEELLHE